MGPAIPDWASRAWTTSQLGLNSTGLDCAKLQVVWTGPPAKTANPGRSAPAEAVRPPPPPPPPLPNVFQLPQLNQPNPEKKKHTAFTTVIDAALGQPQQHQGNPAPNQPPATAAPAPTSSNTVVSLSSNLPTPSAGILDQISFQNFRSIYAKELRERYIQLAHRESVSFAEHFVAGGVGGMWMVLVGHPFDTIKVRLQSMPAPPPGQKPLYAGMIDCTVKTYAHEGVKGFFRGMGAPIVGITPLNSIFFAVNAVCCELQQSYFRTPQLTLWQVFNAGAFSAAIMCLMTAPIERVKCLLQVQNNAGTRLYDGPADVARKLYRRHGLSAVYRGFLITLARDIPSYGTKMMVYEYIKRQLSDPTKKERISPLATLMAGGVAGIFFWLVCIPQDTLKSYLQSAPEGHFPGGVREVWRVLMKEEGPSGLFRGLSPLMARAFPANAACFLGLEVTMLAFDVFSGPLSPVMDWPSLVVKDPDAPALKKNLEHAKESASDAEEKK